MPVGVIVAHIIYTFYWGRKVYLHTDGNWRAVKEVVQSAGKFLNKELPDEYAEMVRKRLRKFQEILLAVFFVTLIALMFLIGQCGGTEGVS